MIGNAIALRFTMSPGVGLSDKRAALDELRTAHRLLLATDVEDDGPTAWVMPIVALLMAPIWFDAASWRSSSASDVELARYCVRRAFELLARPVPVELPGLPLAKLHALARDLFDEIRASDPALSAVGPLVDD